MAPRHIRTSCELSADCERLLERAMTQHGMTARAHDRILKVARTVADLEGSPSHRAQAHRRSHPVSDVRPDVLGVGGGRQLGSDGKSREAAKRI